MTRRRTGAVTLSLIILTASAVALASASSPSAPRPLDPSVFTPVAGFGAAAAPAATPSPTSEQVARVDPIGDFPVPERSLAPRPSTGAVAAPRVVVVPRPTPRPTPRPVAAAPAAPAGGGHRVSGQASWYCKTGVSACHVDYPGGLYAAAGSELRIGDWRGRTVRVCGNGHCVSVKLIDWCACAGSRIIDLYSDAFERLAPLSSGVLSVSVTW